MGFDAVGFQNIGIDGALSQEGDALLLSGFLFENSDELGADDLALLFGLGDSGEFIQKAVHGVDVDQICVHLISEDLYDLLGLALSQKTVIYVDADEILADGFDEQRRHHGGIDASGESQKDLFIAHLGFDRRKLLGDERLGESGSGDAFHCFGSDV